ncbi:MAG: hypothetical protein P8Z80_17010 [Pseudolabrys sp.]
MSLSRIALSAAALALALLAVLAVLDRLGDNARAAARQALLMRAAELERSALQPGSMLPCVDGTAGESVGNACETRVFATPQSTAAAVAYMSARIDLLEDARALVRRGDTRVRAALAGTRRVVALDRYGIAAHVLSRRDGCTVKTCDVFAMLDHTDALKANLKAQTFAQYVARYAGRWDGAKPAAGAKPASGQGPKVSALPPAGEVPAGERARAEATPPTASVVRKPEGAHKPVSARWHFPSADSIPAISIMTPEPKLPKATAHALGRDTARKEAIERRKEGKDPAHKESRRKDSKTKESKARESVAKKEAEKKRQEPGAPLQLTR